MAFGSGSDGSGQGRGLPGQDRLRLKVSTGLRRALAEGYSWSRLRADVMAGIIVGVVAVPLSMALAIASGVPPQHGLYTAIVAGALVALTGGARLQVSGPTAAFVVILAPISAQYGVAGLAVASVLAGGVLIVMAVARMGRLIQFIPHPVTIGFTAGIAVVIALLQVRDFLGLDLPSLPQHFPDRMIALVRALPTTHWPDLTVGAVTLAILILWPRVTRKIPSPLPALTVAAAGAWLAHRFVPGFEVATIASRFSWTHAGATHAGIPSLPPMPLLPWRLPGPGGAPLHLDLDLIRQLLPAVFAIALLGAIESLLSAVIADSMTGDRHDPDGELLGQGVGNLVAPFFGGFAATGALARTATNIRSGAASPLSAVFHSAFVLVTVLLFAPLLGLLPMASLAALLLLVAWNMSEARHVVRAIRTSPRSDVLVLLLCMGLTIVFDMVAAVSAGVLLAAVLFMRRMAEVSGYKLISGEQAERTHRLPPEVLLYEVGGPLFFGAAQKAMAALHSLHESIRVVILDLHGVPAIDATGLVNLESVLSRLKRDGIFVILVGLREQPARSLAKRGIVPQASRLFFCHNVEEAYTLARLLAPLHWPVEA
ncbi:MAG: C4-dicarboxylic acid transporter DauA [Phycisphaerae bacterium]|nr:C4-dicarboxylic acid transporter DauA [Phycisphaerae bacterium]